MAEPASVLVPHIPLITHHSEVKSLKEVEVPAWYYERIRLGVPVLDEVFGGPEWPGILPSCSMLFSGHPGAGKSTMALQLADLFQRAAGKCTLYNCGEENSYMVKMRADRLGVAGDFGLTCIEDADELAETCRDLGIEVLFQDSLQSLQMKGTEQVADITRWKAITKRFCKLAKDTDMVVVLIGHITKGGDVAGSQEMIHDVDVRCHIRLDPDTQERELILTKNRFGPAGIPYACHLTPQGLDFAQMGLQAEQERKSSGSGKTAAKREDADRVIKEALLRGERISRQCHGRLGVDCSDGFWNARLEKVLHDLRAEGSVMGKAQVGGKQFQFIEA